MSLELAQDFLDDVKAAIAPVEADLRDAKRRVSVAKGPKKRRGQVAAPAQANGFSGDEPEEDEAVESDQAESGLDSGKDA